jgi:hypothetical protein
MRDLVLSLEVAALVREIQRSASRRDDAESLVPATARNGGSNGVLQLE